MRRSFLKPLDLARAVVAVLEEKKAANILLLDVEQHSFFADYFVICSGTSERQLEALAKAVLDKARKQMYQPGRRAQGQAAGGWLLVDLGTVIVHLFSPEKRKHYQLEDLWRESKVLLHIQ